MALWTPPEISTALWLDASDSGTITLDGGAVSLWADKSGLARHASQATAAERPIVAAAGQNGLDVLVFDGVNDWLALASSVDFVGKLVALVSRATTKTYGQIFGHGSINRQVRYAAGVSVEVVAATPIWGNTVLATNATVADTMAVIVFTGAALAGSLAVDGATAVTGGGQASGVDFNTIGKRAGSYTDVLGGWLGEIIITEISAVDRTILEGYLAHKWGLASSLPVGHPYRTAAPALVGPVAGTLPQAWNIEDQGGTALWCALGQPYEISQCVPAAVLTQPWGLRLGSELREPWTDAPVRQGRLLQPWQEAGVLSWPLAQPWRDAASISAGLGQEWDILAALAAGLAQPWAVAADAALAGPLVQGWDLRDVVSLSVDLAQPWSIGEDGSQLRYTVSVAVDGVAIGISHLSIEADRAQDVLSCEIHPETEGDWLRCRFGAGLVATITSDVGAEAFHFVVTAPRISEQHGEPRWVVEALSPAALLGDPWGAPVSGELSGLASAVAADLVAGSGVALTWATVDWAIPAACWIAADERPLALLKTLAAAVGAVVQSQPDGSLRIEPDYPASLPNWGTVAPGLSLTETLDVFSVSSDPDYRPGYNRFLISDQASGAAAEGLRLEEETISATVKLCRGYQVPWIGAFTLAHTGGSWAQIEAMGIETRQETEVVEFVAGSGRTRYPIYSRDAVEWLQTNLGTVTVAEDGTLSSAIAGQSLLRLTYTTKCRKWRVRDSRNEQLQLVAEL